jgi:hypothetical protein
MEREPVPGECVVVTANNGDHPARIGDRFIVRHVDDSDETIRGALQGSKSVADFWIPWSDLEPVHFGWQYARQHLPADVVELLSACNGIQFLALNRQVKEVLVDSLPDWKARVTVAIQRLETDSADDFDA